MQHATRKISTGHAAVRGESGADGAAFLVVLYAVIMVAALTLFAGANLLGDRLDPKPSIAWNDPA